MADVRFVEGPARTDVYVGMLILTVLSMLIGCAVLAIEANDYEWESLPPARTKLVLPTDSPASTPAARNQNGNANGNANGPGAADPMPADAPGL